MADWEKISNEGEVEKNEGGKKEGVNNI